MEKEFWLNKWKEKQIGFHQSQYNPFLTATWDKVKKDNRSVFVPLCGKTKDMVFLAEAGHKVVGVELSETAVQEFYKDNGLFCTVKEEDGFKIYSNDIITIYVGDMFQLKEQWLSDCEYIYDRASMVALPLDMRKRYAQFIIKNTKINRGLTIVMNFDNPELGPPFSINETDLNLLFTEEVRFDLMIEDVEVGDQVTVHGGKINKRIEQGFLFERF